MKKHVSVLLLYIRGYFYPCIGTIIGIFIAQGFMFWHQGLDAVNLKWALLQGFQDSTPVICLSLLVANMCRAFSDQGGKMGNTILRLRISERASFWMSVLANACIFSVYFLLQALVFIGFCFWYNPQVTALEILISSYDHAQFHQFFPLQDMAQWVANFFIIAGLSICSAAYPMRQRHGRHSLTTFAMVLISYLYFFLQYESDHLDAGQAVFFIFLTVICIFSSLCGVYNLEVDDNA